jgi:hypothetical protein
MEGKCMKSKEKKCVVALGSKVRFEFIGYPVAGCGCYYCEDLRKFHHLRHQNS